MSFGAGRKKEYRIVRHPSIDLLEDSVNYYLTTGWKLQGGASYDPENKLYIQAITHEAESTK